MTTSCILEETFFSHQKYYLRLDETTCFIKKINPVHLDKFNNNNNNNTITCKRHRSLAKEYEEIQLLIG